MSDKTAREVMEQFHAVAGEIASAWAEVEDYVEAMIWKIAGLEQTVGRALTRAIRPSEQLHTVEILLREKFAEKYQETEQEWNRLKRKTGELRTKRNSIVHAKWGAMDQYQPSPILIGLEYNRKNQLVPQPVVFSYDELVATKESLIRLKYEFINYIEENFKIYPSPPTVTSEQMLAVTKPGVKKS